VRRASNDRTACLVVVLGEEVSLAAAVVKRRALAPVFLADGLAVADLGGEKACGPLRADPAPVQSTRVSDRVTAMKSTFR